MTASSRLHEPPSRDPSGAPAVASFDALRARAEFPVFARPTASGRRLVYLDSAASAQKPQAVLDALVEFYSGSYANVHRGLYELAGRADAAYEGARARIARFLGAAGPDEIIFTRGTTEALNLAAWTLGRQRVGAGDEVLVSGLEHHSNLVPWQMLCRDRGARLVVAPVDDRGDLSVETFAAHLGPRVRLAAVPHVSNALGTVVPVAELAALTRSRGVPLVVDGAQAVPHGPVDIAALGCDLYAFSGHKAFGPTGIGVLWGRRELLAELPPWQGGGDMILSVTYEEARFAPPPSRFEAGTPHIAGAVGLAAALDWLAAFDPASLAAHEAGVLAYAEERLAATPGITLVGRPRRRSGAISFLVAGAHPHDVATILATEGVAVRAGHHCAQPLLARLGAPATTRASFALYNTRDDVDALVDALARVREIFGE